MTDLTYTPEDLAILEASQPIDFVVAQALAIELKKPVRSIVSKASKMDLYVVKAKAKKKSAPTKIDMVLAIQAATDSDDLTGLEKATGASLATLLSALA